MVFLLMLFTLNTFISYAQDLVFIAYDLVPNAGDTLRIGNLNTEECTYSLIQQGQGALLYFSDITLDSDSVYYNYQPLGWTSSFDNVLLSLEFEPFFVGTLEDQFSEPKEGMTCDRQGNLYLAGEKLSRWDSSTGQITELGALPPSMYCRGDLTFRQGKLYLSSIENTLVEVNLNDPMNSSVVMTFPPGTPEIHGLATVNLECDSVETYAVGAELFNGSTIYRIDFDTWTLEELCHFDFFITGLASYDECIFPDCLISVDLDTDNSTNTLGVQDFRYEQACNFPLAITDSDVTLHSDVEMLDSIVIHLTNPLNGDEFLSLPSLFNVDVSGNETDRLILINNGTTEVSDFRTALTGVLYHNENSSPVFGERVIEVQAHFGVYQSTLARSYIPINEVIISPSISIDSISCYGLTDAAISSAPTGGTAPYSFAWANGISTPEINDIGVGTYELTITDVHGCSEIFETIINQPDSLFATIHSASFDTLCGPIGSLYTEANGGTGNYEYLWSNGTTEIENEQLSPDEYTLTVTDENGCSAITTYTLFEGADIIFNINETPCYGAAYSVNGQVYTSDTTFCLSYNLANGCDSIQCYNLDFHEENNTVFLENICLGDSILIQGNYYTSDTIIDFIYTAVTGCDSIVTYEISISDLPIINFETTGSLCDGEEVLIQVNGFQNYEWSTSSTEAFVSVNQPGTYQITVTDNNDCTSSDEIVIYDPEMEIFFSSFDLSCYESLDGTITVDSVLGGQAPYTFHLNNTISSETTFDNLASGEYMLAVQDVQGCVEEVIVQLIQPNKINIESQESYATFAGGSLELSIETDAEDAQIEWFPTEFLPCPTCFINTITPTTSINYEVIVTDMNGCTTSKTISIDLSEEITLYVPNIFSPNNDGNNDILAVYAAPNAIENIIDLTIISRNGHVVYQKQNFLPNNIGTGWDGTFLGQEAQSGVYILYVNYEDITGRVRQEIYDLTLVR